MRYARPLVEATLLRRYKRFLADVRFDDGTEVTAHCANPGRMTSCWEPGCRARLSRSDNPKRKLPWSLEQTRVGGTWIAINTAVHNRVMGEAIAAGRIPAIAGYGAQQPEQKYGEGSRIDFLLTDPGRCYVEVKGVTLLHEGHGAFPDAVSVRARKHLGELTEVVRAGDRAVLLFSVARGDISSVRPADHVDPAYGRALREAVATGVELLAYGVRVGAEALALGEALPVELSG